MWKLSERAKELQCMYAVDDILQNKQLTIPAAMEELIGVIPTGFAYPEHCRVRITLGDNVYKSERFERAKVISETQIPVGSDNIGSIEVGYELSGELENATLLEDETKMMSAVAWRISLLSLTVQKELSMLFDVLQRIDPDMLLRICDRLRLYLVDTLGDKIKLFFGEIGIDSSVFHGEYNTPLKKSDIKTPIEFSKSLIIGASMFLPSASISELMGEWIAAEKAFSIVNSVDSKEATVESILDSVRRYVDTTNNKCENSLTEKWLLSELCHRFLTGDDTLISLVIDNLQVADFEQMMSKMIVSDKSTGNIGGKGSGLFIAKQIIDRAAREDPLLAGIKTPRTWYIATDQIAEFLHYNHLEEMRAYKFNLPVHLRMTYEDVVKRIKNAKLPPHIIKMLRVLLEDMENMPIIVRSSSLLEDRMNSAFSGKYKSLFLANTGTKQQRLEELTDAILEVYASMYNPDSLCYRKERGLINFSEQMGILIQEVVGTRVGPYYLPMLAGVAFSENQLRWSPSINREDGLARIVMGLGTRAVDRIKDDYPVLFSPAKPGLRTNYMPEEVIHYSQKYIDVINLEAGIFETVSADSLVHDYCKEIPDIQKLVSVYSDDMIMDKTVFDIRSGKYPAVITMNGMISKSDLPAKLKRILDLLSEKMRIPVDLEFAFDGQDLYLLQCRAQGRGIQKAPAPIPANLPQQNILFTANRYITNGLVSNISHIVYVDPEGYNSLESRDQMLAVGKAVGLLGNLLPRRQYILMGPGRWGSRGDITLGVYVTYHDISNSAALIEIAREKHRYVPELSFGTHFFQDLVEADIAYIPLYPDQQDNLFREGFFLSADNMLADILPDFAHLSNVIKVIDIGENCFGKTLSIHLNSELEQGIAFFTAEKSEEPPRPVPGAHESFKAVSSEEQWQWRRYMAEQIAAALDMGAMGVRRIYLIGSTNTGCARMNSDIDLLVHFDGSDRQKQLLCCWFSGWSRALAKINFLRTGYSDEELLDIHFITDSDIEKHDSFAMKIDSVTDPATLLKERNG